MSIRILIENIRTDISASENDVFAAADKRLRAVGCFGEVSRLVVHRRSIDARRREISIVSSVLAEVEGCSVQDESVLAVHGIKMYREAEPDLPVGSETMEGRPVIIGFGPARIFCALILAECGFNPLVLEQGGSVDQRIQAVESFSRGGKLLPHTNIQFGAGGAGTFSDGKLTTRIGDDRCGYVLRRLHDLGAPEDILWRAKPHVGTDILRDVIRAADARIRECGGEIRYNTKVEAISDRAVIASGERIPFGTLIIACGHSARDLYAHLLAEGFRIEPKSFSAGVRIEHRQSDIDTAMYGKYAGQFGLVHAEYALSYRRGDRGCYSFCMCPGGEVVAAASEEGGVVTNGMSHHARDGRNANAAIAVSVHPSDYGATPLDAIAFQRNLEQAAFRVGGGTYAAPCQTFGDFVSGKQGSEPKRILPTYRGGDVVMSDFHTILPGFICSMLQEGIRSFGKKIRGFDAADVPMTGVETRTSAPVRILREDVSLCAPGYDRIYPCGEGAGYAGGIMSAAVDGIRVAQAILARYKRPKD